MGTACTRCGDPHPPGTATCPTTGTSVDGGPCGTLVDRYRVERLLGAGGNGAVYRARHVVTERWVALKILRRGTVDGNSFDPLVREARATTAIGSPRIVQVFDAGMSESGDAFMAMELLEGQDLRTLAEREGPLPIDRAVDLVAQALLGLSDAHERGIVHRDVKPANVFVTRDRDGSDLVKVLDFGISKVNSANGGPATLPGQAMGTPGYMAPEQFVNARDADPRADVYAAAVMLYELVAGRRPFEATTYQALFSQVQGRARSLREVAPHAPPALCDTVDRALARDPDARWPTALAFAHALRGTSPTSAQLPRIADYVHPSAMVSGSTTRRDPAPFTPAIAPVAATPPQTSPAPKKTSSFALVAIGLVVGVAVISGTAAFFVHEATKKNESPTAAAANAAEPAPEKAEKSEKTKGKKQKAKDLDPTVVDEGDEPAPAKAKGSATKAAPLAIVTAKGIAIQEPEIVGALDSKEIVKVLKKAAPEMQICRRTVADDVKAQIHVHPGPTITLAQAHPDNKGDAGVARCVANRFKEAAPGWHPGETGILAFEVHLDPK